MSKLILCSGKLAQIPFHFSLTNTNIYSIEELCFYIKENIYVMGEELYQEELVTWLKEEVDMPVISGKLGDLIKNGHSLKDVIVSILCSSDYYEEEEIQDLIQVIDQINNLSPISKLKIKADNYLLYKKYLSAARLYEQILNNKEAATLTPKEYGSIKHNLAIVYLHTISYKVAAETFLDAYSYSREAESLTQYLYALKLGKYEDEFNQAIAEYQVNDTLVEEIIGNIGIKLLEAKETVEYKQIQKLNTFLKIGKINDFQKVANPIICQWKNEYRQGIIK